MRTEKTLPTSPSRHKPPEAQAPPSPPRGELGNPSYLSSHASRPLYGEPEGWSGNSLSLVGARGALSRRTSRIRKRRSIVQIPTLLNIVPSSRFQNSKFQVQVAEYCLHSHTPTLLKLHTPKKLITSQSLFPADCSSSVAPWEVGRFSISTSLCGRCRLAHEWPRRFHLPAAM